MAHKLVRKATEAQTQLPGHPAQTADSLPTKFEGSDASDAADRPAKG